VRYDLHLHSYHSDGTLSPAELMARAHAAGVDVLALTDHDCLDGIADASAAAQALGMRIVPGVEISATWQQMTIHILGLDVRADDAALVQGLSQLIARRHERARKIAAKLDKRHIHDAYDGVARLVRGNVVGRGHFARFLVREGYVSTMAQAFRQYLARGAAAYVPVQWASLEEAVGWIRGAGGQAVIAHPSRYELSNGKRRKLLAAFKECGGSAIEVVCGGQAAQSSAHMAQLAREFDLLGSVGSDYHGPEQTWLEPGRLAPLPEDCSPVWRDWPVETSSILG
jgi:3',5'-nucleoside bisphosphate phosphatase